MSRAPIRTTAIREPEPAASPFSVGSVAAPQKRTRLRKQSSQRSLLDIDASIVEMIKNEYQTDLQWVVNSILGQDAQMNRQKYEINGWSPVTPDMFGGIFDGMYTRKGYQGEIHFEGLVLMERPIELTEEARAEDDMARYKAMEAQKNMVKNGMIPGLGNGMDSMAPNAAAQQKFERRIMPPMDIPTD